jgi:hypothetical protein
VLWVVPTAYNRGMYESVTSVELAEMYPLGWEIDSGGRSASRWRACPWIGLEALFYWGRMTVNLRSNMDG